MRKSSPVSSGESGPEVSFWRMGGGGSGLDLGGEGGLMVGGRCARGGGAGEEVYGVSSLLEGFLAEVETIANKPRRG